MKQEIYAIYDNKAKLYHQPFHTTNIDTAIRSLTQATNDPQTTIHNHPSDFDLFKIGDWDDNTAIINSITPIHCVNALKLVITQEELEFTKKELEAIT